MIWLFMNISRVSDQADERLGEPRIGDSGLRRKAAALASIIALIALVVGSLFGDRGMLQLVAQRQRAEALQRQIEELRAENVAPGGRNLGPASPTRGPSSASPAKQLGLARPGETVFVIREADGR